MAYCVMCDSDPCKCETGEPIPKYVHYNGFQWRAWPNRDGVTVTLTIIGFNNQHTLLWGAQAVRDALRTGTMTESA